VLAHRSFGYPDWFGIQMGYPLVSEKFPYRILIKTNLEVQWGPVLQIAPVLSIRGDAHSSLNILADQALIC